MNRLFSIISVASMMLTAPSFAKQAQNAETLFVWCLEEKEPALIAAIRDAESEGAFTSALRKGAEVCETDVSGFSMGRLFKALNAYKSRKSEAVE